MESNYLTKSAPSWGKSLLAGCLTLLGSSLIGQTSVTFSYTGGMQSWTVPAGVTSIDVDVKGAQGGAGMTSLHQGGSGGRVTATLPVTPGQALQIYVGGAGTVGTATVVGAGGYNGGAQGGISMGSYSGGGGGGASDIRVSPYALADRIAVAGGGGGGGYNYGTANYDRGGNGGGLTGETGYGGGAMGGQGAGTGGSQVAGGIGGTYSGYCTATNGALGIGGAGGVCTNAGGGGGGGYYGGGGGTWSGAGGGSSYVSSSGSNIAHTQGVRTGNGEVIVTYTVTVVVNCDTLTNLSANPSMFCPGSTVDLSAVSTGDSIDWFDAPTGGNYFGRTASTGTLPVSPSGITTYWAEVVPFIAGPTTQTFTYTGSVQNWTVPPGVNSISVDVKGGMAGSGYPAISVGGNGGRVTADIPVTPGQSIQIYVGGAGANGSSGVAGAGGFNGGAVGGLYTTNYSGGGGGGASDIRVSPYGLADRIVVAGGGGGGAYDYSTANYERGGDGGGLVGQDGYYAGIMGNSNGYEGRGGTQSAGGIGGNYPTYCIASNGTLGLGGAAGTCTNSGGGGGGGYYGGGGGVWGGAGGGSSYVTPSGSNVVHTQGYQSGAGEVVITTNGSTCTPPPRQAVTVYPDSIAPVASCQNITVTLDSTGNATITAMDIDGGSADNCTLDSISTSVSSFGCLEIGANNVVLTVYDDSGYMDSCTAVVTVDAPALAASFSFSVGAAGLQYDFTDLSTGATAWAWDFGDGQTSSAQNPSNTYTVDGSYTVCLTVTGACGEDTTCQSVTVVSNARPFGAGMVQLWPNPTHGQFNVRVEGLSGDKLVMELYNLAGQRVMNREYSQAASSMTETFHTDLPAGTYFLRVSDGVNHASLRVVIE